MMLIRGVDDTPFTKFLSKLNVYNWNSYSFNQNRTLINEEELKLMEESVKYKSICTYHHEFVSSGKRLRNYWFYAIVGEIPLAGYDKSNPKQLNQENISLGWFDNVSNPCLVYFYDGSDPDFQIKKYDILYQNSSGAILKKKK